MTRDTGFSVRLEASDASGSPARLYIEPASAGTWPAMPYRLPGSIWCKITVMSPGQIFGSIIAVIFVAVLLLNGVIMLISPSRWFDLPYGLGLHGAMRKDRTSDLTVRALGFLLTFTLVYCIASSLTNLHPTTSAKPSGAFLPWAICIAFLGIGASMIASPKRWIEKTSLEPSAITGATVKMRISGLVTILIAFYFAWKLGTPI